MTHSSLTHLCACIAPALRSQINDAHNGTISKRSQPAANPWRNGPIAIAVTPPPMPVDEMLALCDLARALAGNVSVSDAGDIVAKHLRRLIPFSLCIFYLKDQVTDELEARHAVGDGAVFVRGARVALGQRLTGWVGANRQTICNSDSALDLWDIERSHSSELKSCLSSPLVFGGHLVGVITLHSGELNAFTEDHNRIIGLLGSPLADAFRRTFDFDPTTRRDQLTGLATRHHLEQLLASIAAARGHLVSEYSLIVMNVLTLRGLEEGYGIEFRDSVLLQVARNVQSNLRMSDLLFRSDEDQFVALLNCTEFEVGLIVAERIRNHLQTLSLDGRLASPVIDVEVACIPAPPDGASLLALLNGAKRDARPVVALDSYSAP